MKRLVSLLAVLTLIFFIAGCAGVGKQAKEDEQAKKEPVVVVPAPTTTLFSVKIEGATYGTLTDFKTKLSAVKGVKNIYQGSFSKEEASVLQVEYNGTSQMLADAIQSLKTDKYVIEVDKFDPSSVSVKLN